MYAHNILTLSVVMITSSKNKTNLLAVAGLEGSLVLAGGLRGGRGGGGGIELLAPLTLLKGRPRVTIKNGGECS